jgi:SnoaL-like protein
VISRLVVVGAVILTALALFHVVLAFGNRRGARAVVPTPEDGPSGVSPVRTALSIAGFLLCAAFILVEGAGLGPGLIAPARRFGWTLAFALMFLLHGVLVLRFGALFPPLGLLKWMPRSRFSRIDTPVYAPLAFALALLAGVVTFGTVRGDAGAGTVAPQSPPGWNATKDYLALLLAGDSKAIAAAFSHEPSIDDPFAGAVHGADALARFVAERHAWLAARGAQLTPGPVTWVGGRTVVEAVLRLHHDGRDIDLPIAVVGDDAPGGRVRALRVYHSFWPLEGHHRIRPPLLPAARNAHVDGFVADYQRALAAGDVDAIVATFEPDGYFREPSGEPYVHRGQAELRKFMTQILGAGGIGIEHASVTDDGIVCAIEFTAVRFGRKAITPQAGLAVYERAPSGRLRAARIYDDVNVEVLQKSP